MLLPQIQGGLERYLSELPEKVEITIRLNEYAMYLENSKLSGTFHWLGGFNDLSIVCFDFISDLYLRFDANYVSNEKKAYVCGIILYDENNNLIAQEIRECKIEKYIAKPENLVGASEFLNKVLEKYSFHSHYEEFERLRQEEKIKNQKPLIQRALDAIITGDF